MLAHYLLTLYRSLTRHRLYAALNVFGLAVGIAVFLVLALYVQFQTSFERWIPNAGEIYPVRMTWSFPGHAPQSFNYTMGGLLDELKADFPGLAGAKAWDQQGTVRQGAEVTPQHVQIVDPNFLQVVDLPLAAGDRSSMLHRPDQVVLTQSAARKYLGGLGVIGRTLTLSLQGVARRYQVAGILVDPPKSTDLNFDVVVPLTPEMTSKTQEPYWNHWGSSTAMATYLRLTSAEAQAINGRLDAFTDRRGRADMGSAPPPHQFIRLRVVPLLGSHLIEPADRTVVVTLGLVGALALVLAVVNYVNLATARAGLRAREVAIRKVMGATSLTLVVQFLSEAVVTTAFGALLGLALTEVGLPLVNAAGGLSLRLDYFGPSSILPPVVVGTALVGLAAGGYPAFILSRFSPAPVLASSRTPGGGRAGSRIREALVTGQFVVAIAFAVATGVILGQARYLHNADLGFRRSGLVVVKSFDDADVTAAQRSALLALWRSLPGVTAVTNADIAPGVAGDNNATGAKRSGGATFLNVNWVQTGPDFFRAVGARFIAGRGLDRDHGLDDTASVFQAHGAARWAAVAQRPIDIVLNRTATRALGFGAAEEAIGKSVMAQLLADGSRPLTIVGVVDDLRMADPHQPVPNTLYLMRTDDIDQAKAVVRFDNTDPSRIIDGVRVVWRKVAPSVPFTAVTAEQSLQDYYTTDDERSRLFTLGAVLAVAIGCVGLYGLASFNTARRVKEIGIRKTLGASTSDVLRLLVGQLLRPVILANLLAWPLAWVAMRGWLDGFDQRIALSPLYFVGASALMLAVALLTVVGQALAVARAEPARALRHE